MLNQRSIISRTFTGKLRFINLIRSPWWLTLSNALDRSTVHMLTVLSPFINLSTVFQTKTYLLHKTSHCGLFPIHQTDFTDFMAVLYFLVIAFVFWFLSLCFLKIFSCRVYVAKLPSVRFRIHVESVHIIVCGNIFVTYLKFIPVLSLLRYSSSLKLRHPLSRHRCCQPS